MGDGERRQVRLDFIGGTPEDDVPSYHGERFADECSAFACQVCHRRLDSDWTG